MGQERGTESKLEREGESGEDMHERGRRERGRMRETVEERREGKHEWDTLCQGQLILISSNCCLLTCLHLN